MKLSEHTDHIRLLIDKAFRNRLGRMGVNAAKLLPADMIPGEYRQERKGIEAIREVFISETGTPPAAYEKLVEELTFTLFNRLAALKVMEAHTLLPDVVTRKPQHGDRSFAHFAWLEQNPEMRQVEGEGLLHFFEDRFQSLSAEIPLFSTEHPYHLLPTTIELDGIINAFNHVETDPQVDQDIWKSDDVLGWLYESYNNQKKKEHKESGKKTEYDKVSLQSQVYTPRWVVKFLVDNSLGKLYLEMFPDSHIKDKYKIANAPERRIREPNPIEEIRLIDPAPGSGNFLLYAFDLFYDLYVDQIENYGADYDDDEIAKLIIERNLYGIDLDDRAVQLAQLGLYIKAKRRKRDIKIDRYNIVSSDFFLPEFAEVKQLFENGEPLDRELEQIVTDIWDDLQKAYKFGSLIRVEEVFNTRLKALEKEFNQPQLSLYADASIASYRDFRKTFFASLNKALERNTARQGLTFLNTKTQDAITYLAIISQKYDVAVANPPYTDSADYGPELKKFVDANFKQPYRFNTNLYAAFLKRCCELTKDSGYIGMIHPHTYMFIKTFEDVRKYIINNTQINLLVDYGLDRVNLFGPGILLDASWYVLRKGKPDGAGIFFNITANQQEKAKKASLERAYNDAIENNFNNRVFYLPQEKLKIIEGWPFIYWISDGFREKFKEKKLKEVFPPKSGLATSNNDRFLRFWWEIEFNSLSQNIADKKKWKFYSKGGPYNKWFGNLWSVVNWENNALEMRNTGQAVFRNESFYLKEGITYSASGSKGATFRYLPENCIYDVGGASMFKLDAKVDSDYTLALLNSNVSYYIIDCLNPTVNTQVGDIERIPFVTPSNKEKSIVASLTKVNIKSKQTLCTYRIIESNFEQSPLIAFQGASLKDRVLAYLNFQNAQLTQVLINEAIINELIFEVYELSDADREQVEAKMGVSIGALPVLQEAKDAFIAQLQNPLAEVTGHIQNLPITTFDEQQVREIKEGFATLYQSNNDLEEFCIRHQVNPINVWYWFKEANIMPRGRAHDIALEFLADAIRKILMDDQDGIIPLVGLPGESRLIDRLESHCLHNGFTSAQFMQLDGLLGRPLGEYIEQHFFRNLSDHLNLFMYLPKTPFIWHLSSGSQQGFEAYIIIYKWTRDSLYKLRTHYLGRRLESLEYRNIELQDSSTAQAQNEKDRIRLQIQEIQAFLQKLDELISEGYDPVLDGGVGKNIAPLQEKGMLKADVLNKKQLEKYLNADW